MKAGLSLSHLVDYFDMKFDCISASPPLPPKRGNSRGNLTKITVVERGKNKIPVQIPKFRSRCCLPRRGRFYVKSLKGEWEQKFVCPKYEICYRFPLTGKYILTPPQRKIFCQTSGLLLRCCVLFITLFNKITDNDKKDRC